MKKIRKTKKIIAVFFCSFAILCVFAPNITRGSEYSIFFDKPPETKEVPIIMYHLITKNTKYQGKFGISPAEMEADLKYLKENGYETILMSDLINFVHRNKRLPEKPVILTFDDGLSSDYNYLYPLLEQYDMKAVLSIVTKLTDDYTKDESNKKPHLTWAQVKELSKSKNIEIQNHSDNLHGGNGSGRKKGEPMEAYEKRLYNDLETAQKKIKDNLDVVPTTFTYPLGIISKGSKDVLENLGFEASLSCAEGMNIITQEDEECLFHLKRNIRRSGNSISNILKKLEKSS